MDGGSLEVMLCDDADNADGARAAPMVTINEVIRAWRRAASSGSISGESSSCWEAVKTGQRLDLHEIYQR